jgi:hypothetical protein
MTVVVDVRTAVAFVELWIVDHQQRHAATRQFRLQQPHLAVEPGMQQVHGEPFVGQRIHHLGVTRQQNAHIHPQFAQGGGERGADVGQAAGFEQGRDFRRNEKNLEGSFGLHEGFLLFLHILRRVRDQGRM